MEYYICSLIKDEQRYLDEWIQYHHAVGFTKIFLYEDIESTSHEEITNKYDYVSLNKLIDIVQDAKIFDGSKRQTDLFNNFIEKHRFENAWCAFIDIDEYITFDSDYTLEKFIKEFEGEESVVVGWVNYGANNHIKRPEGFALANYTVQSNLYNLCRYKLDYKSFVDLMSLYKFECPHGAISAIDTQRRSLHDLRRNIYPDFMNVVSLKKCHIKHLFTKSWQDYVWRCTKRGDVQKLLRGFIDFFRVNKEMEFAQDFLMQHIDYDNEDWDALQEEYDKMLAEQNKVTE